MTGTQPCSGSKNIKQGSTRDLDESQTANPTSLIQTEVEWPDLVLRQSESKN